FCQVRGYLGFRPQRHRLQRNRHRVAHPYARSLQHRVADPEPVTSHSVRLKRCLKWMPTKGAFNHAHPSRGKLAAGGRRESENRLRSRAVNLAWNLIFVTRITLGPSLLPLAAVVRHWYDEAGGGNVTWTSTVG